MGEWGGDVRRGVGVCFSTPSTFPWGGGGGLAKLGPDADWQFFFGPDQDELAYPAQHKGLETTFRNQGSELSNATMIPQMTAVTDLTRSEDELSLKPVYAVGDCHAFRLPWVQMQIGNCALQSPFQRTT